MPDVEKRQVMQHIVRLKDEQGMSFGKIADVIERAYAERDERPYRKPGFGRPWSRSRCHRAYHGEKALQARERGLTEST